MNDPASLAYVYPADDLEREPPEEPTPPEPGDFCYGCGNWYGPCVWPCYRQMGYDKFPNRT